MAIVVFVLQDIPRAAQPTLRIMASLRDLPGRFWRYTASVGVFGFGNFAHTLLVLHAVTVLTPQYGVATAGRLSIGLYIFHNVIHAAASYPVGALGDRLSKKGLLAAGYALFGLMCVGFILAGAHVVALAALFAVAGLYIAIVDSMERALAADVLPMARRGTGYGALATVNSSGDLASSIIVGVLWSRGAVTTGFAYAAVLTLIGAITLFAAPSSAPPE